jgi:uncharacterized membrane protein YhaH (DUF805 family)
METLSQNPYQAPRADLDPAMPLAATGEKLTVKQILFSFEGRVPRKILWLWSLVSTLGTMLVLGVVAAIAKNLVMVVAIPLYGLMIWTSLAVSIKRWHDRDKSGWWMFISLIPIVGAIWALIETGFKRGTLGPNRFGGDATDLY